MDKTSAGHIDGWCVESNQVRIYFNFISTRPTSGVTVIFSFLHCRCSMFYISRMDGVLDAWDLLQQHNEPVLTIKVCDEPLLCMRAHESGRFISAGSKNGAAFLIEVSDNMATSLKNDKPLLTAMFDRENKREKILEAKLREIKLKVKTAQLVHGDENNSESKLAKATANETACKQAEQDYLRAVEKEKSKMFPKLYKHRKRKGKVTTAAATTNDDDDSNAHEDDGNNGRESNDDDYEEDEDGSLVSE